MKTINKYNIETLQEINKQIYTVDYHKYNVDDLRTNFEDFEGVYIPSLTAIQIKILESRKYVIDELSILKSHLDMLNDTNNKTEPSIISDNYDNLITNFFLKIMNKLQPVLLETELFCIDNEYSFKLRYVDKIGKSVEKSTDEILAFHRHCKNVLSTHAIGNIQNYILLYFKTAFFDVLLDIFKVTGINQKWYQLLINVKIFSFIIREFISVLSNSRPDLLLEIELRNFELLHNRYELLSSYDAGVVTYINDALTHNSEIFNKIQIQYYVESLNNHRKYLAEFKEENLSMLYINLMCQDTHINNGINHFVVKPWLEEHDFKQYQKSKFNDNEYYVITDFLSNLKEYTENNLEIILNNNTFNKNEDGELTTEALIKSNEIENYLNDVIRLADTKLNELKTYKDRFKE